MDKITSAPLNARGCPFSSNTSMFPIPSAPAGTLPKSHPAFSAPSTTASWPPSLVSISQAMKRSADTPLILWTIVSPMRLIPLGIVLGCLLPTTISIAAVVALAIIPALTTFLRVQRLLPTPHSEKILSGRATAVIEGDFVVFLIGSRINAAFPSMKAGGVGKAFANMLRQLEETGPEVGYLGGEQYIGSDPGKSTTLSVQYWRSYEQLHAWARSPAALHLDVWKLITHKTAKRGVHPPPFGVWHETFLIKDGQYESVYQSMPPMGLALASGNIQPADGRMRTSASRLGRADLDVQISGLHYKEAEAQVNPPLKENPTEADASNAMSTPH